MTIVVELWNIRKTIENIFEKLRQTVAEKGFAIFQRYILDD